MIYLYRIAVVFPASPSPSRGPAYVGTYVHEQARQGGGGEAKAKRFETTSNQTKQTRQRWKGRDVVVCLN